MVEIRRFENADQAYEAAASVLVDAADAAVREHGMCHLALAGGSTPRGLYSRLANEPRFLDAFPWDTTEIFFGDERHVPPDDPGSNYRMVRETLLSKVAIPAQRVHRIKGEMADPVIAAAAYQDEIAVTLQTSSVIPTFDVILLGLGTDGHTASLFPDTAALRETRRLVAANWVETLRAYRITMTFPLINAARLVTFLAVGEEKADAVGSVLQPRDMGPVVPAQLVRPANGQVIWFVDRAAASALR